MKDESQKIDRRFDSKIDDEAYVEYNHLAQKKETISHVFSIIGILLISLLLISIFIEYFTDFFLPGLFVLGIVIVILPFMFARPIIMKPINKRIDNMGITDDELINYHLNKSIHKYNEGDIESAANHLFDTQNLIYNNYANGRGNDINKFIIGVRNTNDYKKSIHNYFPEIIGIILSEQQVIGKNTSRIENIINQIEAPKKDDIDVDTPNWRDLYKPYLNIFIRKRILIGVVMLLLVVGVWFIFGREVAVVVLTSVIAFGALDRLL